MKGAFNIYLGRQSQEIIVIRTAVLSDKIGIDDVSAVRTDESEGISAHILDDDLYPVVFKEKIPHSAVAHRSADEVLFRLNDTGG